MTKSPSKFRSVLHIYTRVSSDPQMKEGTSLEEQRKLGIKTAKSKKMNHQLWEEGSASSHHEGFENRPVFTQLLEGVRKGEVRHIFVSDLNRLSRNKQNSQLIEWELHTNKVTLHTTAGEYELGNPQNDLMFSILSAFSTYDNQTRVERFRLGRFNKISKGYWLGGQPPFGYDLEDSKLVINQLESEWVKKIFELYSQGSSTRDIQNQLTVNGIKTKRGKDIWSLGSIESLLKNSHYTGSFTVTDHKDDPPKTYTVECPRIIGDELSLKVRFERERRSKKRIKNSNEKNFYLLKGILVCGDCGRPFHGRVQTKQSSVYYCPSKERRWKKGINVDDDKCRNSRYLRIEETDRLTWDVVLDVLRNSNEYRETVKIATLGRPKTTPEQDELKRELDTKIRHLESQVRDYKKSLIDLDTKITLKDGDLEHLRGVRENVSSVVDSRLVEIQNLTFQLTDLHKETRWIDWVKKFGDDLKKLSKESPEFKRDFLQEILKDIEVTTVDKQTHQLKFNFKVPYVNDELRYVDPKNKRKGYRIVSGSYDLIKDFDTSKKIYKTTE